MSNARFTMDDVMRHEMRVSKFLDGMNKPSGVPTMGVSREIEGLHTPIIAECKRRGWKYVHSDPTRPSTCGEGICDFIIYADGGRVFNIECKTKTGKLSLEQNIFITWIKKLGHEAHVITSMNEFFDIVNVPHGTTPLTSQL